MSFNSCVCHQHSTVPEVSASWWVFFFFFFFIHGELSDAWGMITVFSVKPSCLLLLFNTLCVHSLETLISVWPVTLTVNTCVHMHTRVLRVLAVRGVLHVIVRHLHLLLSPDAHQLLIVHVSDLLQKTQAKEGRVRAAEAHGWCCSRIIRDAPLWFHCYCLALAVNDIYNRLEQMRWLKMKRMVSAGA